MSQNLKLRRGFDIKLAGRAQKKVSEVEVPETYALKPTDFIGIKRPKLMVAEGDKVKAGTPLMYCKLMDRVKYCSPVSGEVIEIRRGPKRKLLAVVISADGKMEHEAVEKVAISELKKMSREALVEILLTKGVWPNIIQRPYGVVANPEESPKSIFISAFDNSPLAPDYDFLFNGEENYFQAGIEVLRKFTTGKIHVSVDGKAEVSKVFFHTKNVDLHKVTGPHPSGNVGVQIHHLDPVNKDDLVWTVSPYGVIQIGKLFLEGQYDASAIIAVAGSEVKAPGYFKTYKGANIQSFLKSNLKQNNVRIISGNVLTGERIDNEGHLGFYHNLITVIPEGDKYDMFGWILPTVSKLSFHRAFGLFSFLNKKKEFVIDTNMKGEKRTFVQTGVFEKVTPMDILPTYLLKSILAEDYDEMEELGIYEVIEEDLALCEFVDVSKHNIQAILRNGLELIQNS